MRLPPQGGKPLPPVGAEGRPIRKTYGTFRNEGIGKTQGQNLSPTDAVQDAKKAGATGFSCVPNMGHRRKVAPQE